jgi:ethanolamine permease
MPKWVVRDAAVTSAGWSSLATWWAAALSLAMLTTAFTNGVGALGGGVALIAVIWSLARLRSRGPAARSTSDLVGVVLGDRASTMVALLQMCAYLFLAANAAAGMGLVVSRLSPGITDPLDDPDGWWWPAWSAVAVLVAAVVVYTVSTRAVAAICAVLAGAAALVGLSLAFAVLAKVFSGTAPVQVGQQLTGLAAINTVLLAGLSVVGLEVITTANSRLRSVARPMGVALAAAMVCIALIWTAEQVGTTGGFSYPGAFPGVVEGFFGVSGTNWLVMMTACVQMPALLAVMWALRRVAGRIGAHVTSTVDMPGDLAGALMLIPAGVIGAIAVCRSWGVLTPLTPSVAPVLLIIVYLFVAEASSRLPRWQNLTWVIKVLTLVVLVAVVLVPLLDVFAPTGPSQHLFARADVLLRTTIAGLVVAAAAGVATRWPQLVGVDAANRGGKGKRKSGVPVGKRRKSGAPVGKR